jgi:hypothetical protein
MDTSIRMYIRTVALLLAGAITLQAQKPADQKPGPAVGTILRLSPLLDHQGRPGELPAILGRNGTLVTVLRSADW